MDRHINANLPELSDKIPVLIPAVQPHLSGTTSLQSITRRQYSERARLPPRNVYKIEPKCYCMTYLMKQQWLLNVTTWLFHNGLT